MQKNSSKLTVFFGGQFWVGIWERTTGECLEVCKITFGPEPKDCEIYDFVLKNWHKLRFGSPVAANAKEEAKINPKRMQREIKKQLARTGPGTKAQQAIKLSQAEGKQAKKAKSHLEREEEKQRQFLIRQEKKKQKHRGH